MKEVFSEVFMHIAVFVTFLIPFFFFFVVWVQKKAMIRDMLAMARSIVGDAPIDTSGVNFNSSTSFQSSIDMSNQHIISIVVTTIPALVIALIAGAYIVAPDCFLHSFQNAIFALPFIAFAEFTIVAAFMYNFIAVDDQTVAQLVSTLFNNPSKTTSCNYVRNALSNILPTFLVNIVDPPPSS